jgi:uncharacterized membrane protein
MNEQRNRTAVTAAITGLLTLGAGTLAAAADADREQCAGVIRAGQNDCATSGNACHGHVMTDADPEAWIYLPKGTCGKIVGARIVQVVDPTPKNKR